MSWNDGQNEIMAFTDVDASVALGAQIKGTRWGRPDDRIGIAGALNMLTQSHINFRGRRLRAAGRRRPVAQPHIRKVVEAYYAYQVIKGLVATADYQLIVDPAYTPTAGRCMSRRSPARELLNPSLREA